MFKIPNRFVFWILVIVIYLWFVILNLEFILCLKIESLKID